MVVESICGMRMRVSLEVMGCGTLADLRCASGVFVVTSVARLLCGQRESKIGTRLWHRVP